MPQPADPLRTPLERLVAEVTRRVRDQQGRTLTFFDAYVLQLKERAAPLAQAPSWPAALARAAQGRSAEAARWLERELRRVAELVARRDQGRFVAYAERRRTATVPPPGDPVPGSDLTGPVLAMSQGVPDVLRWKGVPVFKTAFDFALYPMLFWELRPRTVLEIGTGQGGAALWMADLMDSLGLDGQVHTVDLKPPAHSHPRVRFLQGDCRRIAEVLPAAFLAEAPHPWLVIEDAHVNVAGVLAHLHPFLVAGDYLIVEDSAVKHDTLAAFHAAHPGAYAVDTRYTDFFGRNATCAPDSIIVRL